MSEKPTFLKRLEKIGLRASVVSSAHIDELREEITSLHDDGRLGDGLYRDYSDKYFLPRLPRNMPNARSIIVIAVPLPMIRTTFQWQCHRIEALIPPTYLDGHETVYRARDELKRAFLPKQYRLIRGSLPVKLLAVRSGLAKYGRNNITYIPRYGSFHYLVSFYSDYDSPADHWQDKEMLPQCTRCNACIKACPTGAIKKDRFLIDAERCLTYHNEKDNKHKFPEWVDPSWHNAIVGCMRCQKACPADKDVADWCEDLGGFTEEETEYLLRGKFRGEKAAKMERKLKRVGLDLNTFPRNLKVLIDNI